MAVKQKRKRTPYKGPLKCRLRDFMYQQNLTLESLSRKTRMNIGNLSQICNGKNLEMISAKKIAKAVKAETNEIWP